MSKKNYTNYSKPNVEVVEDVVEEVMEEVVEEVTEVEEPVVAPVEQPVVEEAKPVTKKVVCERLRVRSAASINASVITEITKDTVVTITEVGDEFYKVKVDDVVGYCMKQFLK